MQLTSRNQKLIEDQIKLQQDTNQQYTNEQEYIKNNILKEIQEIKDKILTYKKIELPNEILELQKEIQLKKQQIIRESEQKLNQVQKQQHQFQQKQEQEQLQKQSKNVTKYTAAYFNQLKNEKARLTNDIQQSEKDMLDLLEQIELSQKAERVLKQQLIYKEVDDESSSELFDHEKMVENLQQVDNEQQELEKYRQYPQVRSSSPLPKNIHSKCVATLKTYKTRTTIIKQAISKMKIDFETIIEKTIKCLRDCNMLETFYINGELSLDQDEKEQLAAHIAEDPGFVTALLRLGVQNSRNVGLLKENKY